MIIADTSQQQLQAYAVILAAKEKPCNIINVQDIDARDKQTTPTRTVRIVLTAPPNKYIPTS